jgi:hypothetical protein
MTRDLTAEHKRLVFIRVTHGTCGAAERWKDRAVKGMTDEQLANALAYELGIEGGGSATHAVPAYHYRAAGLQIWASWDFPSVHQDKPAFKGAATIAMAREVYGIRHPDDRQFSLL